MINLTTLTLTIMLVLVPAGARAEHPYVEIEQRFSAVQMHEAGLDRLTPAELQSLNRLLREEAAVNEASIARSPASNQRDPDSFVGMNDEPIHSRLKGSIEGWQPGTVFSLENGQQWKVLKGTVKLHEILESPQILVVPGVAGRWFIEVVDDMPKARVYRID